MKALKSNTFISSCKFYR